MNRKRMLYPVLAAWETIRLLILIGLFSYTVFGVIFPRGEVLVFCLILGAGHLLMPLGALYLFFTKSVSPALRLVLAAGKVIGLLTVGLGTIAVLTRFLSQPGESLAGLKALWEAGGLLVIFLLDLIFLNLLLSLKEEEKTGTIPPAP